MSNRSQVQAFGGPRLRSWDDYEAGCLATYGGGYREPAEIEIFHHGMTTVFNLLRGEFPPAEQCKLADALLAACKAMADWRGTFDENSVVTFERIAERFYRETGMLAPGKDAPLAMNQDLDARREAWDRWLDKEHKKLEDQLRAAIKLADSGGEGK